MKLMRGTLVVAVVTLVALNLQGKVFRAKAMNGYEDSLAIMWEVLDADKDGEISASELKSADTDSNGSVSLSELRDYTYEYIDDVEADLQQKDTNIKGTYEIYPPTFDEVHPPAETASDNVILELTKADDGEYSVKLSNEEQSVNGTEIKVSGNKFTFETSIRDGSDKQLQIWECVVNDGELSIEFTDMIVETTDPEIFRGKLLVDRDIQLVDTIIEGTYELYPPDADIEDSKPILELTEHVDGEYSVKLTYEDQSVNGTEVKVTGNKCTFKTNVSETEIVDWECAVIDGKLSVAPTLLKVTTVPSLKLKGKLLAHE